MRMIAGLVVGAAAGAVCGVALALATRLALQPPIGEPRLYTGGVVLIIYPGEIASARVSVDDMVAAAQRGDASVPITDWLVEPMPGWHGWWLRASYRVWGRWLATGAPQLEPNVTPARVHEEDWG